MKTKKTILSLMTLALVGAGVSVAAPAEAGTGGRLFNASTNGTSIRVTATSGPNATGIYVVPPNKDAASVYGTNVTSFSIPSGCAILIVNGQGPARAIGKGLYTVYGNDSVWVRRQAC